MKDIDFDELDRAVSSVLGGKTPAKDDETTASTDPAVTSAASSVDKPAESSPVADAAPAPTTDSSESLAAPSPVTAPLAIKRRGKFMDVVHPSSDMRTAAPSGSFTPRKAIVPLAPSVSDKVEDISAPAADTEAASDETPETTTAPALDAPASTDTDASDDAKGNGMTVAEALAELETPGPALTVGTTHKAGADAEVAPEAMIVAGHNVDTTGSERTDDAAPAEVTMIDETSADDDDTSTTVPPVFGAATDAPAVPFTPFLTDTKVDKRPLGAFGDADEAAADQPPESQATADSAQQAPAVPLPRELQPDVVQVEAIPDDTQAPDAATTSAAKAPAGTDADAAHPLFDTSTYHEPIAHEAKSSMPGWVWWLLGLSVCLIVGAGVGYLLFTTGF